ncbi:PQQ-dependent sugar dehydrogenase [Wenzhouxiangella sediminis]|uniref:PQQ-dependent sugar dehydrogenase n=1 Tax=Wenzhouxiangella sediminis TaxID=1792836 RepID=A0A3E1KC55_9GAMM|nr:PQQ-dependent sugar dehydrogenase [Wenzhouxiangella sediminis]RFF32289.1 PQQ-dependent sugar dehydrogenase [Wenzhouxiangella sediminis]
MARIAVLFSLILMCCTLRAQPLAVETHVDGLEHPWSMVFLPDGRALVTERPGRLRVIAANGRLVEAPVAGTPEVYADSQGGLMGLALHPDYAENGWIYMTLAHGTAQANATRVVRGRLEEGAWTANEVLFTAQPFKDTPVHYGGRMAFLPDGTLLVSVGDGFDYREHAQRLDSHLGKIIRIHDDGSVPADNPFRSREDALPEIFSLGHRNPQGLVVEPGTGHIWSHEHGPRGGDELNLIRAGNNYGWPVVTQGVDYSGARVTPYTTRPGMIDPVHGWTPSIAPAGMGQYHGSLFSEWQGDLLVASLVEKTVRRVAIENGEVVGDAPLGLELEHRLRDVRVGPDGALYVLTDEKSGQIIRISY